MNPYITKTEELNRKIWDLTHQIPVFDCQTFLNDNRFNKDQQKSGIDALLTTKPLIEELFRYGSQSPSNPNKLLTKDEFTSIPKRMQAEIIWHKLFLSHSPLSEATRGILTTLGLLKLDPKTRNLGSYRNHFKENSKTELINNIFKTANLNKIVTLQNPLAKETRSAWKKEPLPQYYTALDLTEMSCNWTTSHPQLTDLGYPVKKNLDKNVYPKIKAFLRYAIEKSKAIYLFLNLPSGITLANKKNPVVKIIQKCIIPLAKELKLPLAINFTRKREELTFSKLKLTEKIQLSNIEFAGELLKNNPELKMLLSDENYNNQHALIKLARHFSNLMLCGFGDISYSENAYQDITRQRIAELGSSFIANHTGATVYEELIYKWAHTRWALAITLQERYSSLYRTGWQVTEQELTREIRNLLSDNFRNFCGLKI